MILLELAGIFAGHCLLLSGLAAAGAGTWLVRVTPESVLKLVGFLSLAGPGRAEDLSRTLTGLVQPKDRTSRAGAAALVMGAALVIAGSVLIKISA